MEFQQNNDITKKQQGAEQELGIDPVMAFYRECAELAGMSLDDWLLYDPLLFR